MKHLKEQYLQTTSTLNTSKQDIAKYGELYEETTGELDKTKSSLKKTEGNLAQTQRSLEETKGLYEQEKSKSNSLQTQIKEAEEDIDDLQKRNTALKNENAKLVVDLTVCKGGS